MDRPNNLLKFTTSLDSDFFKLWYQFLRPIHKLTDREIDVLSVLMKYRFQLAKSITDDSILDGYLFSEKYRRLVRQECDMTLSNFQRIMSILKKRGVIINGSIHPKYIPSLKSMKGNIFTLLLVFEIKDALQTDSGKDSKGK